MNLENKHMYEEYVMFNLVIYSVFCVIDNNDI